MAPKTTLAFSSSKQGQEKKWSLLSSHSDSHCHTYWGPLCTVQQCCPAGQASTRYPTLSTQATGNLHPSSWISPVLNGLLQSACSTMGVLGRESHENFVQH